MNGASFLDDLARTLAEPMPRRRALRLLGTTLAAVAVPGIGTRMAQAAPLSVSRYGPCGPDRVDCYKWVDPNDYRKSTKLYCCQAPAHRWACGEPFGKPGECVDQCGGANDIPCNGPREFPGDDTGYTKFQCCKRPFQIGCFPDGECIPNCQYLVGPGGFLCGPHRTSGSNVCCPRLYECKAGECVPPRCGRMSLPAVRHRTAARRTSAASSRARARVQSVLVVRKDAARNVARAASFAVTPSGVLVARRATAAARWARTRSAAWAPTAARSLRVFRSAVRGISNAHLWAMRTALPTRRRATSAVRESDSFPLARAPCAARADTFHFSAASKSFLAVGPGLSVAREAASAAPEAISPAVVLTRRPESIRSAVAADASIRSSPGAMPERVEAAPGPPRSVVTGCCGSN